MGQPEETGEVAGPGGRRHRRLVIVYATSLLVLAAFGAGRLREFAPRLWAGYVQLDQRLAAIRATRTAFADAIRHNAPQPRPNPVLAHKIDGYPILALRRHERGDVILNVLVLPNGQVGDVRLLHSSGSAQLDAAALVGVGGWYYVPAVRQHHPVRAWTQVRVRFNPDPAPAPALTRGAKG